MGTELKIGMKLEKNLTECYRGERMDNNVIKDMPQLVIALDSDNDKAQYVYISNAKLAYDKIIYGSKTQELRFKEFSGRVRNDLSMY